MTLYVEDKDEKDNEDDETSIPELQQGEEVKKEKIDKMVTFLQGKGALMAFFAFLPAIGEVVAIALGFMRSNTWLTIVSMFVGKLIRYILLLYALESAWDAIAG